MNFRARAAACALPLLLLAGCARVSGPGPDQRPRSAPAPQPALAYVYDYAGVSTGYSIERGGRALRASPLLPLQPGDRVRVATGPKAGSKSITVSIAGKLYRVMTGNELCVGTRTGPCTVGVADPNQTAPDGGDVQAVRGTLASASGFFRHAHDEYVVSRAATATTQPDEPAGLAIPLLDTRGEPAARCAVQTTPLAFEWRGGRAPYTAKLYRDGVTSPLATTTALSDPLTHFDGVTVTPGKYHLDVADAAKGFASGKFEVVDASGLPKDPYADGPFANPLPQEVRPLLRARQLAKAGRQYYLAAYESSLPVPDAVATARALRSDLADGRPLAD